MINSSLVIGTRVLGKYVGNVLAFYNGEEYWRVGTPLSRGSLPNLH